MNSWTSSRKDYLSGSFIFLDCEETNVRRITSRSIFLGPWPWITTVIGCNVPEARSIMVNKICPRTPQENSTSKKKVCLGKRVSSYRYNIYVYISFRKLHKLARRMLENVTENYRLEKCCQIERQSCLSYLSRMLTTGKNFFVLTQFSFTIFMLLCCPSDKVCSRWA